MLRREPRNTLELQISIGRECVSDSEDTTVHYADHISRPGLFDRCPLTCHELLRRGESHRFFCANVIHLHACLELARANAHERDTVAVLRIHVRLDLENEAGE